MTFQSYKGQRILAIDLGTKKSGFASFKPNEDPFIQELPVIFHPNTGLQISDVKKLIEDYEIEVIVIGLPLQADGSEGKMARLVRKLEAEIKKTFDLNIFFVNERFSSKDALNELKTIQNAKSFSKAKKELDSKSASVILQDFLDIIGTK